MTERPPRIQVSRAYASDAQAIERVLAEAFAEYQPLYTPGGYAATTPRADLIVERLSEGPIWVAFLNGAIVGTVAAVLRGEGVYVRSMAVLSSARGHGIGVTLLKEIENFAAESGATYLYLSTTPFLDRAISLYEHFGFRRTEDGPHELHGTPLFTMVKSLVTSDE